MLRSNTAYQLKHADAHSAFKRIALECIWHIQSNQDMVLHDADIEGVHRLRVAIRRLRCAFLVFRKVVGKSNSKALMDELTLVSDVLGKARDLDVFVTQILPVVISQFSHHSGMLKLRDKALLAQAAAYIEVRETLSTKRYHNMLLTLSNWIESKRWRLNASGSKTPKVQKIALTNLNKGSKELQLSGNNLANMQPEARHTARIAAKKLRDTAEFFCSLYSTAKSRAYIQNLTQLQDCLGALNDIAITEKLLGNIVGIRPSQSQKDALNIFAGWNAFNTLRGNTQLDEIWLKFSAQKPFWH